MNTCIVSLLAYCYNHQSSSVHWKTESSDSLLIGNGTKQGGLLSPYLFARYIRDVISEIVNMGIGCKISGISYNILAYADDIVLLAPSWRALQMLINCLHKCPLMLI